MPTDAAHPQRFDSALILSLSKESVSFKMYLLKASSWFEELTTSA